MERKILLDSFHMFFDDEVCDELFYEEFDSLFPGKRQYKPDVVLTPEEFELLKQAIPDWEDYLILQ